MARAADQPFPGLISIVTGGRPALTGIYYDVAYARNLDAPTITTGNGLGAGPCFDRDLETGLRQDRNDCGYHRHAPLAGEALSRDSDDHEIGSDREIPGLLMYSR